jgi:hypothetical protein
VPNVLKSGSLNLLEPYALPFLHVLSTTWSSSGGTAHTHNIPTVVYAVPPARNMYKLLIHEKIQTVHPVGPTALIYYDARSTEH